MVLAVLLVPLVVLTVVANVAGAKGLPKTLPNVALQQLIFFSSEQQKSPLKLPESPQGSAEMLLDGATGTQESAMSVIDVPSKRCPTCFSSSVDYGKTLLLHRVEWDTTTHHPSIHWRNYRNSTTCPCKHLDRDNTSY